MERPVGSCCPHRKCMIMSGGISLQSFAGTALLGPWACVTDDARRVRKLWKSQEKRKAQPLSTYSSPAVHPVTRMHACIHSPAHAIDFLHLYAACILHNACTKLRNACRKEPSLPPQRSQYNHGSGCCGSASASSLERSYTWRMAPLACSQSLKYSCGVGRAAIRTSGGQVLNGHVHCWLHSH